MSFESSLVVASEEEDGPAGDPESILGSVSTVSYFLAAGAEDFVPELLELDAPYFDFVTCDTLPFNASFCLASDFSCSIYKAMRSSFILHS